MENKITLQELINKHLEIIANSDYFRDVILNMIIKDHGSFNEEEFKNIIKAKFP